MNKKARLTITTFAFAFLAFALIYYAFYVVPNTGSLSSSGGTGTFWGRYGYSPVAGNNLSVIGGSQKESNVTSALQEIQCSLTGIGGNATSLDCPTKKPDWEQLTNFIRTMVFGAYQALIALFSIFGGFKVLMMELAMLIGVPVDILNVMVGGLALTVFISWVIFIFNRSFDQ